MAPRLLKESSASGPKFPLSAHSPCAPCRRTYHVDMDRADPAEDTWRAALSALLDGEEPVVAMADLMQHLSECASCSTWLDHATIVNTGIRSLPLIQPALGESVVNRVDVKLCACRTGGACLCTDCQCGPGCTCHQPTQSSVTAS
jgi:hypothetical protein